MGEEYRVLHVEDESEVAQLTADLLQSYNDRFTVDTATDPEEAIERVQDEEFDCVVVDYAMPEINGIEFIESARNEAANLPIIMLTARGSEAVASEAFAAGATDYLRKPRGDEPFEVVPKRIEEAIEHRQSQRNYEEIFEKSPDGIVIHDPETFEFVDMNERYAEIYDYTKEEFLDAGFEAIHLGEEPYTLENAQERIQNAIDKGPITFDWPGVRKDGSQFWAEVHLTPITLNGQERLLASIRDVSERVEYEQKLQRQNERLDGFARIIGHDLQNPLNVAEGYLEIARSEYDSEALEAVQRAHGRIQGLLEDLITLTEGEGVSLEFEPISLAEMAEQCWENVVTEKATMVLETDMVIRADQSRIRNLLENLFSNAVVHGGTECSIQVGEFEEGFYVEDDGQGIPDENREEIFDLGYSTNPDGTGYGLTIVKEIANEHGWELAVTESEDGGARFEFSGIEQVD